MPIYLDNAATSFPKPEPVIEAVVDHLRQSAANPGRGGHQLALRAGRLVMECRESLAAFFGIDDASRIAFTANATEAINLGLFGLLQPGDRVVTTSMEHNAVVRPLRALSDQGVEVVRVMADARGFVDPRTLYQTCGQDTRLLIMTHCSNVTGTLQAIEEIGPWCRERRIVFMVDAAQSAGLFPIDVEQMAIDLLAVPGHKGLLGPAGTGFLYVHPDLDLRPLLYGGTGNLSQSQQQPAEMPERLESGTLNTVGLAGLNAGLQFLQATGLDTIRRHEQKLLAMLMDGLHSLSAVTVHGPPQADQHGGALSFSVKNLDPAMLGFRLDHEYGICCRVGLHCAPEAHGTIGTLAEGTVRLSPGYFNTSAEIEGTLTAIETIVASGAR
ncbi:MAG: aminotransferase class V-fold PLP-dependent enzyme [Desulfuromonadales bacterium]|jgi:cysteine desulfurase/selenocysteine lyase